MERRRVASLLVLPVVLPAILVRGQSSNPAPSASHPLAPIASAASPQTQTPSVQPLAPPIPADAPRMSKQTRLEIIRDFETQIVYARTFFPMGAKGIKLRNGVTTPNGPELQQSLALWGPAVKPGDPSHLSFVQIKGDHILFEINGGPIHHNKWYNHIQVSGTGGTPVPIAPNEAPPNPHGTYLDLYFDKYVPEMTAAQLRALLFPVLDFNARNKEEAYLNTVPPKVKEAIQAHHILVGMNTEMVLHAKGKPPKKVRERDGETEYEEWIYGEPPQDVDFVRIVSDEVVRVETMKVGGQKILRTEREVILEKPDKDTEAKKEPEDRPSNAPTLRRPGEDSANVPNPGEAPSTVPISVPNFPGPTDGPEPMPVPNPQAPSPVPPPPSLVAGSR